MKTIDNYNFANKKALIRVDFNVPLNKEFEITDANRINAAIPTIKKILKDGGSVILMSHLGRPKQGPEDKFSLKHLIPYLSEQLNTEIKFADNCVGESAKKMSESLLPGEVLLLENLRFHKEETKGDEAFAEKLSELGDVYINDAFGTAHRAHASTAIIAKFFPNKKFFGYIMENELRNINQVIKNKKKPFTAILGGAKVSGKIEIIKNLLDKVDNMIIGGGMMFTFIKALGGEIGSSMFEEDLLDIAIETIEKANELGVNLLIPSDTVIADAFSNEAQILTSDSDNIPEGWMGLDIADESIKDFTEIIKNSKTILWNGPMGVFEMSNFENGTKAIAEAVADATNNGAFSLIGGGDSVAAINKYGLTKNVSYVSTGGGAMLEFIEGKELPGVKAIED